MDAGMSLQLLICKESKRLQRVAMILKWSMYFLSKSYRFPQNSQEKRLSFVWYILCFFSKNGFGKPRPHSSQIWLFGLALCMSACEARSVRVGKVFGQSGQENNFSLWCLKECCLRLLDVVNPLPHSEHKNGFSPIKKNVYFIHIITTSMSSYHYVIVNDPLTYRLVKILSCRCDTYIWTQPLTFYDAFPNVFSEII